MINLLPPHAKKSLTKDYHIRVGIIFLSALLLIEILTLVFFTPSYYVLNLSTNKLQNELAQRELLSPGGNKEASAELAAIKKEMALLRPSGGLEGSTTPSHLLDQVLLSKPRGIEISAFVFTNNKDKIEIQLSGIASTREDLLAFRKALSAQQNIGEVKFGNSFITRKTDIDFLIMILFK